MQRSILEMFIVGYMANIKYETVVKRNIRRRKLFKFHLLQHASVFTKHTPSKQIHKLERSIYTCNKHAEVT